MRVETIAIESLNSSGGGSSNLRGQFAADEKVAVKVGTFKGGIHTNNSSKVVQVNKVGRQSKEG